MAAALLAGGCIFTPRDAPPPCDPATDIDCRPPARFDEPLTPETVRDNFKRLVETPTVTPNYAQTLDDGFVYVPDTEAGSLFDFSGWNKEFEIRFLETLLETGDRIPKSATMEFRRFEDSGELPGTDEARYNVEYVLTLEFDAPGQDPPTTTETYCARALWDLVGGDRNFWTLRRWEDLEPLDNLPGGPCDGTVGKLRALEGQGG